MNTTTLCQEWSSAIFNSNNKFLSTVCWTTSETFKFAVSSTRSFKSNNDHQKMWKNGQKETSFMDQVDQQPFCSIHNKVQFSKRVNNVTQWGQGPRII